MHRHQLHLVHREAELHARFDHPNVIAMLGVIKDVHGDIVGIVMELATCTLDDVCIQRGVGTPSRPGSGEGISLGSLWAIMLGLARGLVYLHSLAPPVYHRDLKPTDVLVLLAEDGSVIGAKLGDFGESKVRRFARTSQGCLD
jgi:serine/threonine protein kinase